MNADLQQLYQDLILDHFKSPRCRGCLEHADASAEVFNPLCGDQIILSISCTGEVINDIKFSGKGCSISQASASMMADACRGKTRDEVQHIMGQFRGFMRGEVGIENLESIGGDLFALEGVRKFSARIKCALLAWDALGKCVGTWKDKCAGCLKVP